MDKDNLYAPPTAHIEEVSGADRRAELTRQEHLKHEASLTSVGSLYLLGAIIMLFGSFLVWKNFSARGAGFTDIAPHIALNVAIGVVLAVVGTGLRKLKPIMRIPATVISVLGLFAVPIGTILNAYILYLIFCRKGRRVLSPDYADIVKATPHIKYRTSWAIWAGLILIVGLIVIGIAVPAYKDYLP